MSTESDRIELEKRVTALEAQTALDHRILVALHEQQKKFYASLTALQSAFDALIASMDPSYKPEPPAAPPRNLV
jgi:hypothetical protein